MKKILDIGMVSHAHGSVEFKMIIIPKEIYRVNGIPITSSTQLFIELQRTILNFIWKHTHKKNLRVAKIILNNKRTAGGIITPNFKLYYKAIVIKTTR